jgi:hypothetical protein
MAKKHVSKFINWPPPGTTEAKKVGCICPVEENNYGIGLERVDGTSYLVNLDCKVHKKLVSG